MPKVEKSIVVPYTQQQMFELVNDVASYPAFLPFCSSTEVISSQADCLEASLTLSKGGISKSFTTRNTLVPYESMTVSLLDGPFKSLEGDWRFVDYRPGVTQIQLDMSYEFDSKMLAMVFGPLFAQVAGSLVDAFYQRAKEVYACK